MDVNGNIRSFKWIIIIDNVRFCSIIARVKDPERAALYEEIKTVYI